MIKSKEIIKICWSKGFDLLDGPGIRKNRLIEEAIYLFMRVS